MRDAVVEAAPLLVGVGIVRVATARGACGTRREPTQFFPSARQWQDPQLDLTRDSCPSPSRRRSLHHRGTRGSYPASRRSHPASGELGRIAPRSSACAKIFHCMSSLGGDGGESTMGTIAMPHRSLTRMNRRIQVMHRSWQRHRIPYRCPAIEIQSRKSLSGWEDWMKGYHSDLSKRCSASRPASLSGIHTRSSLLEGNRGRCSCAGTRRHETRQPPSHHKVLLTCILYPSAP